jgi:hypothetical protein
MKQSEIFSLNQWLSWYDDSMTYAEIIAAMRDPENIWQCADLDVWEAVETFPLDQVAEFIDDTKKSFEQTIQHMGITQ